MLIESALETQESAVFNAFNDVRYSSWFLREHRATEPSIATI